MSQTLEILQSVVLLVEFLEMLRRSCKAELQTSPYWNLGAKAPSVQDFQPYQ